MEGGELGPRRAHGWRGGEGARVEGARVEGVGAGPVLGPSVEGIGKGEGLVYPSPLCGRPRLCQRCRVRFPRCNADQDGCRR